MGEYEEYLEGIKRKVKNKDICGLINTMAESRWALDVLADIAYSVDYPKMSEYPGAGEASIKKTMGLDEEISSNERDALSKFTVDEVEWMSKHPEDAEVVQKMKETANFVTGNPIVCGTDALGRMLLDCSPAWEAVRKAYGCSGK